MNCASVAIDRTAPRQSSCYYSLGSSFHFSGFGSGISSFHLHGYTNIFNLGQASKTIIKLNQGLYSRLQGFSDLRSIISPCCNLGLESCATDHAALRTHNTTLSIFTLNKVSLYTRTDKPWRCCASIPWKFLITTMINSCRRLKH